MGKDRCRCYIPIIPSELRLAHVLDGGRKLGGGSHRLLISKCKGVKPMDMMPCLEMRHTDTKPALTARARLKLLILEADEQTMDRIIEAIEFVCGADSDIKQ